ncbi:MAG: prepilin-type N-terminal cleavage/methylation domain-containing protein [Planctomycetota bacterium]
MSTPQDRQSPLPSRSAGFTIVEMTMVIAISAILIAVALTVGAETLKYTAYAQDDFSVQHEANRAYNRITEVLRKTGWSTDATETYPRVIDGGAALELRLLDDLDGNGWPFSGTSGDLEWGSEIYTIRREADGTVAIFDNTDTVVWTCGRLIESISFETVIQEPSLHFQEVRITILATRTTADGVPLSFTAAGSVHMRN